jgi:hypothetical protein
MLGELTACDSLVDALLLIRLALIDPRRLSLSIGHPARQEYSADHKNSVFHCLSSCLVKSLMNQFIFYQASSASSRKAPIDDGLPSLILTSAETVIFGQVSAVFFP